MLCLLASGSSQAFAATASGDSDWFELDLRVADNSAIEWAGIVLESPSGWEQSGSTYSTTGSVSYSSILRFDGTVEVNTQTDALSGSGKVFLRENRGADGYKDWEIVDGSFGLSVVNEKIVFDVAEGEGALNLAGFDFVLPGFSVSEKSGVTGLEFASEIDFFKGFRSGDPDASFEWLFRLDETGFGFNYDLEVAKINLGLIDLRDTKIEIRYRDAENNYATIFIAESTVWPKFIGFGIVGSLELYDGRVNRIGLGAEASIPPGWAVPFFGPPPVFFVQKVYGEVDGLADEDPWSIRLGRYNDDDELTGGLEVTVGPQYLGKYAAKLVGSGEWISSGRLNLSGDFYLYSDDWRFGRTEFSLVPWTYASFSASLEKEISGPAGTLGFAVEGASSIDTRGSIRGRLTGKVYGKANGIPVKLKASRSVYVSLGLDQSDGSVNEAYVATDFEIGRLYVSALYDFESNKLHFPSNVDLRAEFMASSRLQGGASILSDSTMAGFLSEGTYLLVGDIEETGSYLFSLDSDHDLAAVELVSPQGDVVLADGSEVARLEEAGSGLLYTIELGSAGLGEWRFRVPDGFDDPDATVSYMRLSPPVGLASLTLEEEASGTYQIQWDDGDAAEGRVDLLLSETGTLGDAFAIHQVDTSDEANAFLWTPEGDLAGSYRLLAMVSYPGQTPGLVLAPERIELAGDSGLAAPQLLSLTGSDGTLAADWADVDQSSGYEFEYEGASDPSLGDVVALEASIFDAPVSAGQTFRARVRAYRLEAAETDEEADAYAYGPWSDWSEIAVEAVAGQNNPPVLGPIPLKAKVGEPYAAQTPLSDPDGHSVSAAASSAPAGMTVSPEGSISWTPSAEQLGLNLVRLTADDGQAGGLSEREYQLLVYEAASAEDVSTSFSLAPGFLGADPSESTASFLVEAPDAFTQWSLSSPDSWIEILSPAEGELVSGNQTVRLSLLANDGFDSREGRVELSDGSVFNVAQEGFPSGPITVTDDVGGATVELDGDPLPGATPLQILQAPYGVYEIAIYKEGVLYERGRVGVSVEGSAGVEVHFAQADVRFSESYQSWLESRFTTRQLSDRQTVGFMADADGDGSSNGLEYLAQLDPLDPDSRLRVEVTLEGSSFYPLADGVAFRVERSEDLATWESVPEDEYRLEGERLELDSVASETPRFYRVVFEGEDAEIAVGASTDF